MLPTDCKSSTPAVKRYPRRRGKPVTVWLTPQQNALLADRAAEMGLDRSELIRGALWAAILDPTLSKNLTGSDGIATSPSRSGSHLNLTTRYSLTARNIVCPGQMSFVAPSRMPFLIMVGHGTMSGTPYTSGFLSEPVGGWHTPKASHGKSLPHHDLDAICSGYASVTATQNLQFLPLEQLFLLLVPRAKVEARHGLPPLVIMPRSGSGIQICGHQNRAYNEEAEKRLITMSGGVATLQLKYGVLTVDEQDAWLLYALSWNSQPKGKTFYARAIWLGATVYLHRILGGICRGEEIDHKNNNGLDNRRENIRPSTRQLNVINRNLFANNKSGFRGVCWDSAAGRWLSAIKHDGHKRTIGRYTTPEEAARAFDAEAVRLRGADARLNYPAPS